MKFLCLIFFYYFHSLCIHIYFLTLFTQKTESNKFDEKKKTDNNALNTEVTFPPFCSLQSQCSYMKIDWQVIKNKKKKLLIMKYTTRQGRLETTTSDIFLLLQKKSQIGKNISFFHSCTSVPPHAVNMSKNYCTTKVQ